MSVIVIIIIVIAIIVVIIVIVLTIIVIVWQLPLDCCLLLATATNPPSLSVKILRAERKLTFLPPRFAS